MSTFPPPPPSPRPPPSAMGTGPQSHPASSDADRRYPLRWVLAIAGVLRMVPMPFLAFLSLYGLASIGTNEFELIGRGMVIGLPILLLVGVCLTFFMAIVIAKNRPKGMATASGLTLATDIVVVGIILFSGEEFDIATNGYVILGTIIFLQSVLFGWAMWAAR